MKVETFTYDLATRAWSVPSLPELDSPQTLVLAFGAPEMVTHPNVFQLLRDAYPSSQVMGCSSAGVMAAGAMTGARVQDRTLSVAVARFERTTLDSAAVLARDMAGSRTAGVALARKLSRPGLRALFLLTEGIRIDGEDLVAGVVSVVGDGVVVTGGMAGDGMRFERTWVSSSNRLQSGLIAAVGLYGEHLIVEHGVRGGWEPFGPERVITRSEGNLLYELDGQPAIDIFEPHLRNRLSGLPATGRLFPLTLWQPADPAGASVRNLLAVNRESGALVFAGDLPQGFHARLMRADPDRLAHSAGDAAVLALRAAGQAIPAMAPAGAGAGPGARPAAPAGARSLCLAVSCVSRRIALGAKVGDELGAIDGLRPPGMELAGFYGYGVIAPAGSGGRARLYTQSIALTVLGEIPDPRADAGPIADGGGPTMPDPLAWGAEDSTGTMSPAAYAPDPDDADISTATGIKPVDSIGPVGPNEPIGPGGPVTPQGASGNAGTLEVTAFSFDLASGAWSVPELPAMDSPRTLVLVFGAPAARAQEAAITTLHRTYPRSHVLGCSTAGEIFGAEVRDDSLSVLVARFARTDLASDSVTIYDIKDSYRAGKVLARKLLRPDLRALLVLGDGTGVHAHEVARGVRAVVGDKVVVSGGLGGDGTRFERAWVVAGGPPDSEAVVAVGFYGDHVVVGHGTAGPWEPLGPEHVITRCRGRVVHELDGLPALDVYREAVDGRAAVVALRTGGHDERRLWGTVLAVHETARSMTLAAPMLPGARVQLMRADPARMLEGATEAAMSARRTAGAGWPAGAAAGAAFGIAVSSVGRRLVLGERAEDELAAAARAFTGLRVAGFYGYGVVAALSGEAEQAPEQAMGFTVFGESLQPRPAVAAGGAGRGLADELAGQLAHQDAGETALAVAELDDLPTEVPIPRPPPIPMPDTAAPGTRAAAGAPEASPEASFEVAGFTYDMDTGRWSVPALPALDSPQTMILAFGASALSAHPEVFSELREAYPRSHILGCSSAGEVAGVHVADGTLSVAIVRFVHTTLTSASVVIGDAAGSFPAGQVLAHKLNEPGLRAILVLAEGLEISGSELLRGINSVIDPSVVVTGGLAGDGLRFERTWVLSGDKLQSSLVTAVGLYGEHLILGHGAEGGWEPFGPEGTVTRATGNTLYEMDGRPALAWYKQHLGDQATGLPATGLLFPLALCGDEGEGFLVRTVLAIDDGQQSMTFAGGMPEGARAQILCADFAQLLDGASHAARAAASDVDVLDGPGLGLIISDLGRRVVLGDGTDEEIATASDHLPEGVHTVGFYGYGGFSSFRAGPSELHNQTLIVTVLGESATPFTKPTSAAMRAAGRGRGSGPLAGHGRAAGEPMRAAAARRSGSLERRAATGVTDQERARPVANLLPGSELSAYRRDVHGVAVIELAGRLNESFDGRALAASLSGTVVLDLARVERVTSFGVREWLRLMTETEPRVDTLYLANCSEAMVNQFVMIRAMVGSAHIISFMAPYMCRACNHTFTHVHDCERDAAAIQASRPPPAPCPQCGAPGAFDDDVGMYFPFARGHAGRPVPAQVRQALAEAARVPGTGEAIAEAIEKTVTEELTRIRINGVLDDSIRWSRILDGVEGVVRLDLGGVTETTPEGVALLQSALRSVAGSTRRREISHCPSELIEALVAARPALDLTLISAYVPARCDACNLPRTALVDVAGHQELLARGTLPSLMCKRCSSVLSFHGDGGEGSGARALLRLLARSGDRDGDAPAGQPPRGQRPWWWSAGLGAAAAAAALTGASALWSGGWRVADEQVEHVGAVPAPSDRPDASGMPGHDAGAPVPPVVPVVPPPWVDRQFVVEDEVVRVVGRSGPATDVHAATTRAYAHALHLLLRQMVPRLQGAPIHGFLHANVDLAAVPGDDDALSRIVNRYTQQVGARALLTRDEAFPEERDGQVTLTAWYWMQRDAFEEVLAYYRQADTYMGMTVVPMFPLLEQLGTGTGALLVVAVEEGGPAARGNVQPGHLIVKVGDHYVSELDEYSRVVRDAWSRLRKRRSLQIEVISQGKRVDVRLKKR